jgi:hypothetical protein
MICDGWSLFVLFRELSAFYTAYVRGESPSVPALPIQYSDYVEWQHRWLNEEVIRIQLQYWKKRLNHARLGLEIPTDRSRPRVQSYRGATQYSVLSDALSTTIKSLSRREGVTLFMSLLAGFKALLYRYSGNEDIVLTAPVAYRSRPELENLIGYFNNRVILRTDLSGDPTLREIFWRVRKTTLGALDHQDVPFERVVEELAPNRQSNQNSLVQISFNMLNVPDSSIELPGLRVSDFLPSETTAQYDLALYVREQENGISFRLIYNTDLFDAVTISRMLEDLEIVLEMMARDMNQHLSGLPPFGKSESDQRPVNLRMRRTAAGGLHAPGAIEDGYEEIKL